jgi:hypothetical protein
LTGNPGLAAGAGGGVPGFAPSPGFVASAAFGALALASDFWAAAVASLFEPQPAIKAAVTRVVRIVTLRMVGVCTTHLYHSDGRSPQRRGPAKKIIASEKMLAGSGPSEKFLQAGLSRRRYFADLSVSYF